MLYCVKYKAEASRYLENDYRRDESVMLNLRSLDKYKIRVISNEIMREKTSVTSLFSDGLSYQAIGEGKGKGLERILCKLSKMTQPL